MELTKAKKVFLLAILCLPFFSNFSASASSSDAEKWIITPQKFSGKAEYQELVPKLILESLPENISRDITLEEQEAQWEENYRAKSKELISKLSKLQTEKDQLFFKSSDKNSKKKELAQIEAKINDAYKEIEKHEQEYLSLFQFEEQSKIIEISDKFVDSDFLSTEESNTKKIDAVLSGNVIEQNGFLFIKSKITILPLEYFEETESFEGIFSMEASAVGNYSEIQDMTMEIAQNFLSFLMNKDKIQVSVQVFPEEIKSNVTITIDGTIYKNQVENLALQQGEHSFSVEAPGYETRNFTNIFEDSGKTYNYSVYLTPIQETDVELLAQLDIPPNAEINTDEIGLYVGGIKHSLSFEDEQLKANFLATKFPIFGEFTVPLVTGSEEDAQYASTFFRITGSSMKPVTIKTESSTDLIEKARKRMYTSYGILLSTLPFSFYADGRLTDVVNAINSGVYNDEMYEKYLNWRTAYKISIGTSLVAGINMIIQLGRYIYTANTVLPQN